MPTHDPLSTIFTSEKEVDVQLLADILAPYLRINIDDGVIFFTDVGNSLSIPLRLLLFFLARKALKLKGLIDIEAISPSELISDIQLKEGSVHPGLKSLKSKGLVMVKDGKYFVPNHQLGKVKTVFIQKENYGA